MFAILLPFPDCLAGTPVLGDSHIMLASHGDNRRDSRWQHIRVRTWYDIADTALHDQTIRDRVC